MSGGPERIGRDAARRSSAVTRGPAARAGPYDRGMSPSSLEARVREERRRAWSLAYRMLGTVPAADLVVHDALRSLGARTTVAALGPALFAATLQLSHQRLRRRRQRGYVGPWLPGPVDTARVIAGGDRPEAPPPGARWSPLETGSYAFLLALEALSPRQRAVALLVDALGRPEADVAAALGLAPDEVRAALRRARDALEGHERRRLPAGEWLQAASIDALGRALACLGAQDVAGLAALLAPEAEALGDGGGELAAPRVPVRGAERIAALLAALVGRDLTATSFDVRELNGLPALVVERASGRFVLRVDLDLQGRVAAVHLILAREKLAGLDAPPAPPPT